MDLTHAIPCPKQALLLGPRMLVGAPMTVIVSLIRVGITQSQVVGAREWLPESGEYEGQKHSIRDQNDLL